MNITSEIDKKILSIEACLLGYKEQIQAYTDELQLCEKRLAALKIEKGNLEIINPGDIVETLDGLRRLIVRDCNGKVFSVDDRGIHMSAEELFKSSHYRKVGRCEGFKESCFSRQF